MRMMLTTGIMLEKGQENYVLTTEDKAQIENSAKKLNPQGSVEMSLEQFKEILPEHVNLRQLLDIFQVIPSPPQEYEIILNGIKDARIDDSDTCYVINNTWFRSWKLYVSSYMNNDELKIYRRGKVLDSVLIYSQQMPLAPLEEYKAELPISTILVPSQQGDELYRNSITRPGEINNSELSGVLPFSLKSGLRVLLVLYLVQNRLHCRFCRDMEAFRGMVWWRPCISSKNNWYKARISNCVISTNTLWLLMRANRSRS
eukprot:TRINITY_DN15216_c0_g2_i1.p1 TRINITY_DN15216_c0_g2~~TRINITY_DN15216_c0_g2_i1.p1  ORF type:complete len:258 (+),score=16.76 TRINITY_DN15216_c0_g2_i1:554-1327(+)